MEAAHDAVASVRGWLLGLQDRITSAIEAQETAGGGAARFLADAWDKPAGEKLQGNGLTKICLL